MTDRSRKLGAILAAMLFSAGAALADGKFYDSTHVPPDIPYQRAAIFFRDGAETLVLQSKFELNHSAETNSVLGWVVPTPSVPTLDSMSSSDGWTLFGPHLGSASRPLKSYPTLNALLLLCPLLFVTASLLLLLSFLRPSWAGLRARRRQFGRALLFALALGIALFVSPVNLMMPRGLQGVEVLRTERVGIYNTAVLQATRSADLVAWLVEHGLHFTEADAPVLESYIRQGWCFVTATVSAADVGSLHPTGDRLVDPLILRFRSPKPVYPLALTATVGANTELLIYLLSDHKVECDGRLELRYAGPYDATRMRHLTSSVRDDYCLLPWELGLTYLCKFQGTLTPEQMRTDLVFSSAPNDRPYRERQLIWKVW